MGLVLLFGYAFQTVRFASTTSSNAGFITGVSVVLVPIIYYSLRRRLPPTGTICCGFSYHRFILLSVPMVYQAWHTELLILVCALCFAIHVLCWLLYSHLYAIAITGIQILFVGLVCLGIGLLIEPAVGKIFSFINCGYYRHCQYSLLLWLSNPNALQKYSTPTPLCYVTDS